METIKELNMEELEQVTGGDSLCAVIGCATDGPDAAVCIAKGIGPHDTHAGGGFNLCIYLGIGFGSTW